MTSKKSTKIYVDGNNDVRCAVHGELLTVSNIGYDPATGSYEYAITDCCGVAVKASDIERELARAADAGVVADRLMALGAELDRTLGLAEPVFDPFAVYDLWALDDMMAMWSRDLDYEIAHRSVLAKARDLAKSLAPVAVAAIALAIFTAALWQ